MIRIHKDDVDLKICHGPEDQVHIHAAKIHAEFRASAQRAHQQLALHLIGVSYQDANRCRNANARRLHSSHPRYN
jgi:hypothetical protein